MRPDKGKGAKPSQKYVTAVNRSQIRVHRILAPLDRGNDGEDQKSATSWPMRERVRERSTGTIALKAMGESK